MMEPRNQGGCLTNQKLEEGLHSVATPIHDLVLRKVASIDISGQVTRTGDAVREDRVQPQLLSASQAMTHLLSVQRAGLRHLLLKRPLQDLRAPITSTTAPNRMAPMLSH